MLLASNDEHGLLKPLKLDAFKVQDVNVHEIAIGNQLPPDAKKVFGQSPVYVALAPNAVFATLGPAGKEAITEALMGKLAPGLLPCAGRHLGQTRAGPVSGARALQRRRSSSSTS